MYIYNLLKSDLKKCIIAKNNLNIQCKTIPEVEFDVNDARMKSTCLIFNKT